MNHELFDAAKELIELCKAKKVMVAVAESCTGGLVTAALTEVAGSSKVLDRGFVTYSYEAKSEMLGVPQTLLSHSGPGAVSQETAEAMARGAIKRSSKADIAVAITGVAGPGSDGNKPEGLVHFAAASRSGKLVHVKKEYGALGRSQVRHKSVLQALAMLKELAEQ